MNGVWRFFPQNRTAAGSSNSTPATAAVYYIRESPLPVEDHSFVSVIRTWIRVNERSLSGLSCEGLRRVLHAESPEFHEAIDEVVPLGGSDTGIYGDSAEA